MNKTLSIAGRDAQGSGTVQVLIVAMISERSAQQQMRHQASSVPAQLLPGGKRRERLHLRPKREQLRSS
jgi:hypothetical protein